MEITFIANWRTHSESAGINKPALEFPNIAQKKNCFQFHKYKINLKIDTI